MDLKKLRKIKVNVPGGAVKHLVYKPVNIDETSEELACNYCAYKGRCEKFRNPETPDDPESSFMEFCADLGTSDSSQSDQSLLSYIPVEGTLEENLSDIKDVYQTLIEKNGYVKVTTVIDCVCKETCPYWNEDHSNCTSTNQMCLLEDLIKKSNE